MSDLANSPSEVWGRALDLLKTQMERATFHTLLARTWVIERSASPDGVGSEWVIGVPNPRALDWLTHRLTPMIARTLSWTLGAPATVRFVVATQNPRPEDPRPSPPSPNLPAAQAGDGNTLEDTPALDEASSNDEAPPGGAGPDLVWTDFYIKLKVAFRKRALARLKGARLSVFLCLSLHVDRDGIAKPGGIETIMHETGYSRGAVCSALEELERAGLIRKLRRHHGADQYQVLGYAWFGTQPAPALWEVESKK